MYFSDLVSSITCGRCYILFTLIFLVGEMLEKFLWRSDYIFGLSLTPENQSSKKFSILTSHFEGQVQKACSHQGPSAKLSIYLIDMGPFILILPRLLHLDQGCKVDKYIRRSLFSTEFLFTFKDKKVGDLLAIT